MVVTGDFYTPPIGTLWVSLGATKPRGDARDPRHHPRSQQGGVTLKSGGGGAQHPVPSKALSNTPPPPFPPPPGPACSCPALPAGIRLCQHPWVLSTPLFGVPPPGGKGLCRTGVLAPRWGDASEGGGGLSLPDSPPPGCTPGVPPSCHLFWEGGGLSTPQDPGFLQSSPCLSFPARSCLHDPQRFQTGGGGGSIPNHPPLAAPGLFPPPPPPKPPNPRWGLETGGGGGSGLGWDPPPPDPADTQTHPGDQKGTPTICPPPGAPPRSQAAACRSCRNPSPLLCRPPASLRTPKTIGGGGGQGCPRG